VIDTILEAVARIDGILWGPWTMAFIAGVAVYLTVRSRFFQARRFPFIVSRTFGKIFEKVETGKTGRLTPFQAAATALAGTVGMANMAGVATALSVGGPGSIFWMWSLALLGMITKTAEITLAVHYREVCPDGSFRGGPMYTITKALGWKFLAKVFSLGVLVNALLTATLLQSHTVGRAFLSSYGINPYLTTSVMAVLTGFVVIGGVRRIGRFCERLVPAMSLLYVAAGLVLVLVHAGRVPAIFAGIVRHAFAPVSAAGGAAGYAVMTALKQGMARGMLSNEAGLGTAPMAHAMAETPHPFAQGLWGAFEVFVDTIVICSITAFAILSTGVMAGGETGIELLIAAFTAFYPPAAASAIISLCILTFCLTTQIGFFIYFETSLTHAFGPRPIRWMRWVYLVPGVLFAGFADVDRLWVFANISVGVCAIPNLVSVLVLSGVFIVLMKDFLEGRNAYRTEATDASRGYVKTAKRRPA
jgi:AGCS family alanine or glycine:cation symporter